MIAYRLYLGSKNSRPFFSVRDQKRLEAVLNRNFEGWSIFDARGAWQGRKEEAKVVTLFVTSSSQGRRQIEKAAQTLRQVFQQYSILIERGGRVMNSPATPLFRHPRRKASPRP